MKNILLSILALGTASSCFSQQPASDTNFIIRINAVEWLPDGKQLLLSTVKFHKTDQSVSPISRVFLFDLATKKILPSLSNANKITVSPNGRTLAFYKRDDNRRENIFLYDLESGSETVLKTDTFRKYSLSWSPDGRKLTYNIIYNGVGQNAMIDVCTVDIFSRRVKQITKSGKFKSYLPSWAPDGKHIVYYLEKGDHRDQIYLTNTAGSFHRNISNDTALNYYLSWINSTSILYTVDPNQIATINIDGTKRQFLLDWRPIVQLIMERLAK